ncbi:SapC family protein [Dyella mobilis]|uniref:SapC family protein n=1 Tax=Dyella mobilis TaxID=1849582 RepID=A0ABS2KN57_9GAMM|nr:SapC family protein [Dyella mobilis]MBM7132237.1 SapC family protein [Dyella mobilis]GLQ95777.1 peptidase [Dyella mobilis]
MAEVLFYERPVPLNRNAHKDLRIKGVQNLKFAHGAHSVPLTCTEFPIAARDIPILFAGADVSNVGPMALLGLRQSENLFLDNDGYWERGVYVPAFVRRYPFVLAEKPKGMEGDDFTVFLDEGYEGFSNTEGERLFKEDGTDSDILKNAVSFLGEFQQHVARTRQFVEDLVKHDLLEARNIQLQRNGNALNLNGLFVVSEEKLRNLDAETAHRFLLDGTMGWIFAHLLSLQNIDRVSERLAKREDAEAGNTTKN